MYEKPGVLQCGLQSDVDFVVLIKPSLHAPAAHESSSAAEIAQAFLDHFIAPCAKISDVSQFDRAQLHNLIFGSMLESRL